MADYFTQFSCALDVGSAENVGAALTLLERMRNVPDDDDDDDEPPYGFAAEADPARPNILYLSDNGGHGNPAHVIAFVFACAETFDLAGRWGFTWSLSCARARLDGFGGGAQLLDLAARKSLAWTDCDLWLATMLDPETDPQVGLALR